MSLDHKADSPPQDKQSDRQFAGEMNCSFEAALAMVEPKSARRKGGTRPGLARRVLQSLRILKPQRADDSIHRHVAFDGFTSVLHEEKVERDRRYGNVYTVDERPNAYLVRIEMPRRVPSSSLKDIWNIPDEMPDYDYSLALHDNVLAVRAGVPGETMRRLSYISASFPADFLTRIRFECPVSSFKHRLHEKVVEAVVFKTAEDAHISPAA